MNRKLDYSSVWKDTQAQLNAHREGVGAISGLFLFVPDWVSRLFAGQPDLVDASTPAEILAAFQVYYAENWLTLLPTGLLSFFGAVAIYVLLTRKELATIGSALGKALALLPFYFVVQLAGGVATLAGFLALILPGMYLAGRLTPLGAVAVAETERGFSGTITRAWDLTRGNGWSIFFLTLVVALVASLTAMIIGMVVGLACRLLAGAQGVPFVETGVDAALGAVIATLMVSLSVAIYRNLAAEA
ncbi:MAG TPA: hypothetical protein PKC48_00715 [Sphingorhabdus sp.]|uniref:hypothetical protein n=1 Tax=Sphingorhabdus sp. TaxID=1902408 RepID=UPI002BA5F2E3|nr:hypothetical protein [Sphingorhabdus sp.]HMT41398.1 hypothetical protein [Sphingorhabdus sp.]HMU20771.1 hypothetical protein [Sphingorhabdus sp.]